MTSVPALPPETIGPVSTSGSDATILVEGSTFCISGTDGDIFADRNQGLFVRDVRVLSHWRLRVDGSCPQLLAVRPGEPFAARFIARELPDPGEADSSVLVVRNRHIGDGMREDIVLHNTSSQPRHCTVEVKFAADFADLFEVKASRPPTEVHRTAIVDEDSVRLSGQRHGHVHDTILRADGGPVLTSTTFTWEVDLTPREEWRTSIEVMASADGIDIPVRYPRGEPTEESLPAARMRAWRRGAPRLDTADARLASTLRQSIADLGALRIFDPDHPERAAVAAGAPWFMALFGRDSLLTSWMVLPLDAGLAIGTLQELADHQGTKVDAESEEEPGRILHETRLGPATGLALGGHSVYYGTADATPLFVMLIGELHQWGYDDAVTSLLPAVDRALGWITDYGDRDGDGFVEYARTSPRGLVNQGWKDSGDSINFADGRLATAPIALAEVQGYCYAAFLARSRIAESAGDRVTATHWRDRAADLKRKFDDAFWLPDRGWYAIALDGDKRPVDSLASNMGHCLWTGIVPEDRAPRIAELLTSSEMFTGWGIRTLANSMAAYNPMSYHNGSVWPHDSAICAAGLARYGFAEQAQRVALGLVDAARYFDCRLPELICGFDGQDFDVPVPYPTSCSPQAWAAAAPLLLLRSLLGIDPDVPAGYVRVAPHLPQRFLPLALSGMRIGTNSVSVEANVDGWHVSGLQADGLRLESGSSRRP